jgi:hypothetical protein
MPRGHGTKAHPVVIALRPRPSGTAEIMPPSSTARRIRQRIVDGQIWRKMDGLPTLWVVEGITQDSLGHMHVRLRRLGDPTTIKLIAARSLEDGQSYTLEQEPHPAVPEPNFILPDHS